jgi:uncharacterized YceG family protein
VKDAGSPRHGRHASPDDGGRTPSWDAPSWAAEPPGHIPEQPTWDAPTAAWDAWDEPATQASWAVAPPVREHAHGTAVPTDSGEWAASGPRPASGLLERYADGRGQTGPMPEWRHRNGGGDPPSPDSRAGRDAGASGAPRGSSFDDDGARHPSSPLPPMPRSVWSKLQPRSDRDVDEPTAAADALPGPDGAWVDEQWDDGWAEETQQGEPAGQWDDEQWDDEQWDDEWSDDHHDEPHGPAAVLDDDTRAQPAIDPHAIDQHRVEPHEPHDDWDRTGGLEVIGDHVEEERHRGWFSRSRSGRHEDHDLEHGDLHPQDRHLVDADDGDIPIAPYDPRPHRRRKRRKRAALVVCLVVLVGLVGGVVIGGQKLWGMFASQDYTGAGTGSERIRVHQGDTLTDIAQTMVDHDVIASTRPFVKAAEANPQSTAIAPGLYGLRHRMSGKAALDLLLAPSSRLVSRVTVPEGKTVKQTLQLLAQGTGVPIDQLQAVAAKPTELGLPDYAHGSLEGFLFPATYDFEPGMTPTQMLTQMVQRAVQTLDQLQIPAAQRLEVVTKASIVQAESGSAEDMPKVARVLDNRLAKGMLLQLDTTVNYANGKSGLTTTTQDRQNPSPYNTYVHPGLPPGPISNPGEEALRAVLSPAQGNWLYFVVVNPDTGETRFAATAEEHSQNVALFQQWLRAHPGG